MAVGYRLSVCLAVRVKRGTLNMEVFFLTDNRRLKGFSQKNRTENYSSDNRKIFRRKIVPITIYNFFLDNNTYYILYY